MSYFPGWVGGWTLIKKLFSAQLCFAMLQMGVMLRLAKICLMARANEQINKAAGMDPKGSCIPPPDPRLIK